MSSMREYRSSTMAMAARVSSSHSKSELGRSRGSSGSRLGPAAALTRWEGAEVTGETVGSLEVEGRGTGILEVEGRGTEVVEVGGSGTEVVEVGRRGTDVLEVGPGVTKAVDVGMTDLAGAGVAWGISLVQREGLNGFERVDAS